MINSTINVLGKHGFFIKFILVLLLSVCLLLIVYLTVDSSNFNSTYISDNTYYDNSYKDDFKSLIHKVDNGLSTGIPTVDDSSISLGEAINVTPGSGDWSSFPSSAGTSTKSVTLINRAGFSYGKTASSELDMTIYNPFFLENCTVYEPHGIVKFMDKYILVATGTYLSYKLGLPSLNDRGLLYRVTLDTGKTYDIIVIDTKGAGATENVLKTPGYNSSGYVTLGHPSGYNNFCLTEFYKLCTWTSQWGKPDYYPIRKPSIGNGTIDNGIDYINTLNYKTDDFGYSIDLDSVTGTGVAINNIPAFNGNVIKFEPIKDSKAEEVWNESISKYFDGGYDGKNVVYDAGGVICTH